MEHSFDVASFRWKNFILPAPEKAGEKFWWKEK
jgi:hypothetical protein